MLTDASRLRVTRLAFLVCSQQSSLGWGPRVFVCDDPEGTTVVP